MSKRFRNTALLCLGAILTGTAAGAQVTTEDAASVIVFPKVIADGSRDTFIQVSNVSNSQVHAACFYVNGRALDPDLPPGPFNQPLWQPTAFEISLTARQPTNWLVSAGRAVDPSDPRCGLLTPDFDCYGAGADPGLVPAIPTDFVGELVCIETDALSNPIGGNHLTGEATIKDLSSGDVAKYGAIGLAGLETNDGDGDLVLGQEYAACPETWLLDHTTEGSEVPSVGAGSSARTHLTVVPCGQDLRDVIGTQVVLLFSITNEFEQNFSSATSVDCWGDFALGDANNLFDSNVLGTLTAQTLIRPSSSSGAFLLVAEELQSTGGLQPVVASASANVYAEGAHLVSDVIRIP